VHITPSYALHLAQDRGELRRGGSKELGLKFAVMGAEPYSIGTMRKIEEAFGVKVFNCLRTFRDERPAVAFECRERCGMHIWEDNLLRRDHRPGNPQPVRPGEKGELVLTTLNRTGMPILRYRTKDLTKVYAERCACGTHAQAHRAHPGAHGRHAHSSPA